MQTKCRTSENELYRGVGATRITSGGRKSICGEGGVVEGGRRGRKGGEEEKERGGERGGGRSDEEKGKEGGVRSEEWGVGGVEGVGGGRSGEWEELKE